MTRNLFGIDNARDMLKQELVSTFIETSSFKKLLTPANQIIIGSRGSGKTALLKMICHDHLSLFDNDAARQIVSDKTFIGIFISTKTKFSGGLRNKAWLNESEQEKHFVWHMNVASCLSLMDALKSCLNTYVSVDERIKKEVEIVSKIKTTWLPEDNVITIKDVNQALENLAIKRQIENQKIRITNTATVNTVGYQFDIELFDPLFYAIRIINNELNFQEKTSWFICIDEIEMLDEFHHRILNSYMRSKQPNIFFKYTTLPYCHYTTDTNLNVPLDVRHDVSYVYIDQDDSFGHKAFNDTNNNAKKLFQKRAQFSRPGYTEMSFEDIFGESVLLNNSQIGYSAFKSIGKDVSREDIIELMNSNEILRLFLKYMNSNYCNRGIELLLTHQSQRFGNQFGRKVRGILLLKDYFQNISGKQNLDIYSGAKTVIAVGDCNPRKLIKIFNEMLIAADKEYGDGINNIEGVVNKKLPWPLIKASIQHKILATIAEQELNRYKIEKDFGNSLYAFMDSIGQYMSSVIHGKDIKLTTEQVSSVEITLAHDEKYWELIKRAVQKGLLYPNVNYGNPDDMPIREGVFHLAFILSPKFRLLPRRGDAKKIDKILNVAQLELNFDA